MELAVAATRLIKTTAYQSRTSAASGQIGSDPLIDTFQFLRQSVRREFNLFCMPQRICQSIRVLLLGYN